MSKGNQGQISMWLATRGGAILLFAVLAASVMPQGHAAQTSSGAGRPVPTTLAEAHAELARTLSAKVLKQIDAMKSEAEMGDFHFSLGLNIRNGWGLWRDSPLQQYMRGAGFTHPDDMSSVILATFWCARHGKPLRLEERAAEYAAHWEEARRLQQAEDNRVTSAKQKMQSMMMGLNLNTSGAVSIRMPDVGVDSIRARFLAPYRGGVLLAVRRTTGQKDDDFIMEPYFLSPADKSIHRVTVPELQKIHSVVAAAETVWIAGVANSTPSILELSASGRRLLKLPSEAVPPQLGLQGDSLLAVYPHRVYKLVDSALSTLYQGNIQIPRSGPPPQLIGDRLFLRDEGRGESNKRLWWDETGRAGRIRCLTPFQGRGISGPVLARAPLLSRCCAREAMARTRSRS